MDKFFFENINKVRAAWNVHTQTETKHQLNKSKHNKSIDNISISMKQEFSWTIPHIYIYIIEHAHQKAGLSLVHQSEIQGNEIQQENTKA